MPKLSFAEKKKRIEEKQAKLAGQLKKIESAENQKARRDDTRRKVIAGAIALYDMQMRPDDPFAKRLRELLNNHVAEEARPLFSFIDPKPPVGYDPHINKEANGKKFPRKLTQDVSAPAPPPPPSPDFGAMARAAVAPAPSSLARKEAS